jgi:alkyl hydroperoxide reductase subunit AhpC
LPGELNIRKSTGTLFKTDIWSYVVELVFLAHHFAPFVFTFHEQTEIISFSDRQSEFAAVNCQVIALSCDSVHSHLAWINMPRTKGGLGRVKIPIVADTDKSISRSYGVLLEEGGVPLRGLFIIDAKGILRQATVNDLPVGRNVDEVIRLVKAFQYTDIHGEVCPANWQPGAPTMYADPQRSKEYFSTVSARSALPSASAPTSPTRMRISDGPGEVTRVAFRAVATDAVRAEEQSKGVMSSVSGAFQEASHWYSTMLQKKPLQTRAVTGALLAIAGELIGSYLRAKGGADGVLAANNLFGSVRAADNSARSSSGNSDVDVQRLIAFGLYGLVISGPVSHWWQRLSDYLWGSQRSNSRMLTAELRLVLKVAVRQLLLVPPLTLATVASLRYLSNIADPRALSQTSLSALATRGSEFRNQYAAAVFTNWRVWTLALILNNSVVPGSGDRSAVARNSAVSSGYSDGAYREVFEALVTLWWNTYLSIYVVPPRR